MTSDQVDAIRSAFDAWRSRVDALRPPPADAPAYDDHGETIHVITTLENR